jgi:hypothetical protein
MGRKTMGFVWFSVVDHLIQIGGVTIVYSSSPPWDR